MDSQLDLIKAEAQLRALGSLFLRKTEVPEENLDMDSAEANGVYHTLCDIADCVRNAIDGNPNTTQDADTPIEQIAPKDEINTMDDLDLVDEILRDIEFAMASENLMMGVLEGEVTIQPYWGAISAEAHIKLERADEGVKELHERLKAAKNNSEAEGKEAA